MKIWPPALGALGALAVAGILASPITAAPPVAPKKLSAHDAEAKALLAKMTLEEKVGQMTQAEQEKLTDVKDIQTYFLGSLRRVCSSSAASFSRHNASPHIRSSTCAIAPSASRRAL